ncbi:MAG: hypothetical protein AB1644_08205 [Candidatus Zixiibacteriota bacterium]
MAVRPDIIAGVIRSAALWAALIFLTISPGNASAQSASYEEIVVNFDVPRLVSRDLLVRFDGRTVYLPLTELFDLLDLNIKTDFSAGKAAGFFLSTNVTYELDFVAHTAKIHGRDLPLMASDFVRTEHEFYLRIDVFETIFGLNLTFDFAALRVLVPLNDSFPAYQKLKRKQAREKLQTETAELKNIRVVPPRHEYFSGGAADWVLSANPLGGNGQYFDLTLGSMVMGGDLTLTGSGNTVTGVQPDQFGYRWHYYVGDNPYLTQAELGDVFIGGPLSRSLEGGLLTNRPQIQRTYFQTITLSGHLQPGWEVELYVDSRLVDFATVDEHGDYSFNLDIMYGASLVTLKKFGPNGEIRTEEQFIRVPYNLVPKNTAEYSVGAGSGRMLKGKSTYTQAAGYYGVTRFLTVGAGADLPVADKYGETPLVAGEATCQIFRNLTANGSFSPNYQAQLGLNYSMPSFVNANVNVTRFERNSFRNALNQQQNITFSTSVPLRLRQKYIGLRYYVALDKFLGFSSTSMNFGFNTTMAPLYINYTGKYKVSTYETRKLHTAGSQVLVSAEIANWFRPQFRMDYAHDQKLVTQYGVYLTRRMFRTAQLSIAYERYPLAKSNSIMVNVNFFNQIAYFASRFLRSDRQTSMSQVQRGSIRYDRVSSTIRLDRRSAVGFGSAVVRPFVDKNNDGSLNDGEEFLPGMKAKVNGAGGRPVGDKRLFFYDGLRAYDEYVIQVDPNSLDNPMLKPSYENFKVSTTPNVVTSVDVPVLVASDISGLVQRQTTDGLYGVGGIRIKVLNVSKDIVTEIPTFNNGEYYYLGLIPGMYRAYIDPGQLEKFGYRSKPESIQFQVNAGETAQSVEHIDFVLTAKE